MLHLIRLILPTIFPSWRFFKEVEASPRLEWRSSDVGANWHSAMHRRTHLTPWLVLRRLVWNRNWNEYLFLVTCSERLLIEPTQHAVDEIVVRLCRVQGCAASELEFRICLVDRVGTEHTDIETGVAYESYPPHRLHHAV